MRNLIEVGLRFQGGLYLNKDTLLWGVPYGGRTIRPRTIRPRTIRPKKKKPKLP